MATLSRRVGLRHVEAIEDAVQSALMSAVEHWRVAGLPNNPSAWLFRVAQRNLMGTLRSQSNRRKLLQTSEPRAAGPEDTESEVLLAGEIQDDVLRMLFVCCDEGIPAESQLVFALKAICGFSVREIAYRLLTSEANVYKRYARARRHLQQKTSPAALGTIDKSIRISAVLAVLYAMFTEGHLSSHDEIAIRRELCDEAIRLGLVLADHPLGKSPQTFALLALMHLHVARLDGPFRCRGTAAFAPRTKP